MFGPPDDQQFKVFEERESRSSRVLLSSNLNSSMWSTAGVKEGKPSF